MQSALVSIPQSSAVQFILEELHFSFLKEEASFAERLSARYLICPDWLSVLAVMWCTSAYRTRLDWFQWSSFWSKGSFICWWSVQLQGRNWEQWRLYTGGIDGKNYKMTPLLEAFCWFVAPQAVFITTLLRANKNVRRWWEARWVFARLKSDTLTEQKEHICKTSYCLSCVCFLFKLCSLMCLTQSRRVV